MSAYGRPRLDLFHEMNALDDEVQQYCNMMRSKHDVGCFRHAGPIYICMCNDRISAYSMSSPWHNSRRLFWLLWRYPTTPHYMFIWAVFSRLKLLWISWKMECLLVMWLNWRHWFKILFVPENSGELYHWKNRSSFWNKFAPSLIKNVGTCFTYLSCTRMFGISIAIY